MKRSKSEFPVPWEGPGCIYFPLVTYKCLLEARISKQKQFQCVRNSENNEHHLVILYFIRNHHDVVKGKWICFSGSEGQDLLTGKTLYGGIPFSPQSLLKNISFAVFYLSFLVLWVLGLESWISPGQRRQSSNRTNYPKGNFKSGIRTVLVYFVKCLEKVSLAPLQTFFSFREF